MAIAPFNGHSPCKRKLERILGRPIARRAPGRKPEKPAGNWPLLPGMD